ncbi:ABC transporter substrate-binding protein, partial [Burkholderia sp. Tr-860]|nr:ABC transporter substrate-binding protein [Burkholderia sp. Tr-860]
MSRLSIRGTLLLGTALLCATLLLAACGGNDDAPRPAP